VIGWYLRLVFARWLIRTTGRLLRWGLVAMVLIGCAPVTMVAGVWVAGGVAARVAAGPAAPRRLVVAADDRRLPDRTRRDRRVRPSFAAGRRA
jgi:hypothetical protein